MKIYKITRIETVCIEMEAEDKYQSVTSDNADYFVQEEDDE